LRNREAIKYCYITPSDKSVKKAFEEIRERTNSKNGYKPIKTIIKEINNYLRGWGQYFHLGNPSNAFSKINRYTNYLLYKFLQRRSQRGYKKTNRKETWYEHFKNMGLFILMKERFRMKAQGKSL